MSINTRLLICLLLFAMAQPCLAQPSFAQDSKQNFSADLQKAIGEKQYDQAIELLDRSVDAPIFNRITGRTQVASLLMQAARQDEAIVQFDKACTAAIEAAEAGQITNQTSSIPSWSLRRCPNGSIKRNRPNGLLEVYM